MKKLLVKSLLIAGATFVCTADELTWSATPASAVWNSSALNWLNAASESVAWNATHNATFGESSEKTIAVSGTIGITNITFNASGYVLGGDGTLQLENLIDGAEPNWTFTTAEGVTARIDTKIDAQEPRPYVFEGILIKDGNGTLQLGGDIKVLRLHGREGLLDLSGANLSVAKLRASREDRTSAVHLDNTRINVLKSNNMIFFGDTVKFKTATIGEGGLFTSGDFEGIITQDLSTAPGIEKDGGITHEAYATLVLKGNNTFNGGIHVKSSQLRTSKSNALGTGDILLDPFASFYIIEESVDVYNKIVQSQDSMVGSAGGEKDNIIIHSVGVTESNEQGKFQLGRINDAYSKARLSLTGETSEPVGTFKMLGNLDLTIDGGVLTARPDSPSMFFTYDAYYSTNTPFAKVGQGGFVFDSNGAMTELGIQLDMTSCRQTNAVDVAGVFTNPDFEEGNAGAVPPGWHISKGVEATSGKQNNNSGFTSGDAAYQTTNGVCYVALRRESTLSTTFNVPEEGDWRIAFDMGCRSESNYRTYNITVTVTIDDEHTFVIGPREKHAFKRFETEFYSLAAGEHTLKVTTDNGSPSSYDSVLFDAFKAERITRVSSPVIEKRGEGMLGIDLLSTDGDVNVCGGKLALRNPAIDGAEMSVAGGAELSLSCGSVSGTTITVANGGTLALSDRTLGVNLVKNGSFEADQPAGGYDKVFSEWSQGWAGEDRTPSGVQKNGSAMSPDGPYTSFGDNTCFLRYDGIMRQTVYVPQSGRYKLSFFQASRIYGASYKLALSARIGDTVVITNAPRTANYGFFSSEAEIDLEKGDNLLSFTATGASGSGVLLLIDNVRLERVQTGITSLEGTTLDFASGATLDLQTGETIVLDSVRVDGKPVKGNVAALRAAGVNVTGNGKVRIGPPQGTVLLIR